MNKENPNLRKLGLGTQSFETLINGNYIYVDKTQLIYNLFNNGRIYFLSRPRRFGKSLLVSTFEELFRGNKELFKDLYIYDKWNWNENYNVLYFDMGRFSNNNNEFLELTLSDYIMDIAKEYNIELNNNLPSDYNFSQLIKKIYIKTKKEVVVLIDEYDKPIMDNLMNYDLAQANQNTLQKFYNSLKVSDRYLKFIFITGVTKFSKTSIFSDLNHLTDISLEDDYSEICGYTKKELNKYFKEYLNKLSNEKNIICNDLIKEMDDWYDGYSWNGKNFVYNPWSILNFFRKKIFDNYWFESGTPTFLLKLIEEKGTIENSLLKPIIVSSSAFSTFKLKNINLIAVLMQTGYLTIKKREEIDNIYEYTLDIPNNEVRESLFTNILSIYTNIKEDDLISLKRNMIKQIVNLDSEGFNNNLNDILTDIPNLLHQKADDNYYHSIFIAWLSSLRFKIDSEVLTNIGRIDSIVETQDYIAICEIKHDNKISHKKQLQLAINQIKDNEYYKKYLKRNKRLILIAIAFKDKKSETLIKEINI